MNIKVVTGVAIVLAVIYFFPALQHMKSSRAISGETMNDLKKSAMNVRRNMTTGERNLFDTAFGVLQKLKAGEGDNAFVQAVNGLEPDQLVELAKQEVDSKIAAGDPDLKKYTSWEDMIAKLTAEAPKKGGQPAPPLRQSEREGRP